MITIENAKVEILSAGEARPAGKSMIVVTIGDHVFDLTVDHKELIDALVSAEPVRFDPDKTIYETV